MATYCTKILVEAIVTLPGRILLIALYLVEKEVLLRAHEDGHGAARARTEREVGLGREAAAVRVWPQRRRLGRGEQVVHRGRREEVWEGGEETVKRGKD